MAPPAQQRPGDPVGGQPGAVLDVTRAGCRVMSDAAAVVPTRVIPRSKATRDLGVERFSTPRSLAALGMTLRLELGAACARRRRRRSYLTFPSSNASWTICSAFGPSCLSMMHE